MDGVNENSKITQLDARRMLCPLPVIRTQDAILKLNTGDIVVVTCTDPGAKHDIPSWCRINGHSIEKIEEDKSQSSYEITLTIRVNHEST